ncbi:DUF1667 domain-containing protein [Alkaliphilus peptidifermentans]|uniref:CxxC motif-containing protein n=1 Tax=Alkaliphilus peptidifermentans DSM 18978 TaxID=1120976 RepID=A0A1G5HTW8_9FIRM|nr:DUF1667 domain-containing protein [Alkaliphilus peptidifermentans]SCY67131.1 CxxC motif-containing protein [Alkaliphilus peptidifermentans DSM 18978]
MKKQNMVCIACPLGCQIEVEHKQNGEDQYIVTGNKCPRGKDYGIKEMTNPTRVLTSTVKIKNAHLNRLPVRSIGEVPKGLIFKCMDEIDDVEVISPIKVGDIIIKNIMNTGIDIVASRSM